VTGSEGDPNLIRVPTDVSIARAPEAVVNEWMPYLDQLTLLPNTTVPYQRPATPPVTNATAGAVDDVTARRWADALMREFAWENWAISTAQIAFLGNGAISDRQVEAGVALPQGATGLRISGSRWPTSLRLVKVDSSAQTFMHTSDIYAMIVSFAQPWSILAVYSDGHTEAVDAQQSAAGATGFVVGHLVSKPDLGEIWYGTASYGCVGTNPPSIQTLCAE